MSSLSRFASGFLLAALIIAPITVGLPGCGSGDQPASPPAAGEGGTGGSGEDPPDGGGSGTNNY